MELWKTLDYWEIRTLLAIKRESSRSPDIKLQEIKNEKFNEWLDSNADKSLKWRGESKKGQYVKSFRGIKKFNFKAFS